MSEDKNTSEVKEVPKDVIIPSLPTSLDCMSEPPPAPAREVNWEHCDISFMEFYSEKLENGQKSAKASIDAESAAKIGGTSCRKSTRARSRKSNCKS